MENVRKRINIRLVNNEKDFLKYTSRPTHIPHKIFDKNYAAIHEISICLISVTIQKIQSFLIRPIKKLLVK